MEKLEKELEIQSSIIEASKVCAFSLLYSYCNIVICVDIVGGICLWRVVNCCYTNPCIDNHWAGFSQCMGHSCMREIEINLSN